MLSYTLFPSDSLSSIRVSRQSAMEKINYELAVMDTLYSMPHNYQRASGSDNSTSYSLIFACLNDCFNRSFSQVCPCRAISEREDGTRDDDGSRFR